MKPKPALEISLELQQNGNCAVITRRPGGRDRGQRQTTLKTRLNDRGAPRCEWHITTTPQMTTKTQTGLPRSRAASVSTVHYASWALRSPAWPGGLSHSSLRSDTPKSRFFWDAISVYRFQATCGLWLVAASLPRCLLLLLV